MPRSALAKIRLGQRSDSTKMREIGLPMVEEAFDEARRVENHELMDSALAASAARRDWPT